MVRADRDGAEKGDQKETWADDLLEDKKAGFEPEKKGGREEQQKPDSFDILTVSLPGHRFVTDHSALCILLESFREIDVLPAVNFSGIEVVRILCKIDSLYEGRYDVAANVVPVFPALYQLDCSPFDNSYLCKSNSACLFRYCLAACQ